MAWASDDVWVRLMCQPTTPLSAASRAAVSTSSTRGSPVFSFSTWMSRTAHDPSPHPMALSTASLAAKRAA